MRVRDPPWSFAGVGGDGAIMFCVVCKVVVSEFFLLLDYLIFGPFTREEQALGGLLFICVHLVFTSY